MVRHLESILERNLADFVGVNEAAERMMATCPDLLPAVEETEGGLAAFAGVLRALVAEQTPIAELRAVCERYFACRQESVPLLDIAEEVRLLPEITKHLAGNTAGTGLITMDDRFEQVLLAAIHRDGPHSVLVLKPDACQEALRELKEKIDGQEGVALVADAAPVRPFLRKLIELEWPQIPVLTRRELITELQQAADARVTTGVALGAGPAVDATDLNATNEAQR